MKKLKGLTLLLVCFMLILAACGGNNANDKNVSANNGEKGNVTAPPVDEPAAVEETPVDLGGRTIKLATWWDDTPQPNDAEGIAAVERKEELEKKYNIKIEWINIPFEDMMDKITTTTLAGEPFADIVVMEYKRALVPINDGLILPLSQFTLGNSDVNNEQKLVKKLPPLGGDEYAFTKPGVGVVGLHYNRELFKKLGLPDLQEVYNSGQWNWEKFIEIAKDATRDTDNDGKIDSWGTSGWPADTARHFGAANDAKFVDDSVFKEGISDPKMKETLEFVNRIVNVENINKVKSGNKMDWNETRTFKDGDVAMAIMYDWDLGDVTFDKGVVPIPKGPSGTGKYAYANTALNGWFIPKGVKDPQIVYQIFEELQGYDKSEEYLGQNWLEGRYTHESDIQMALDNINGKGMVSVEEGVPDFPFYAIMDEIIIQNQSVSATIEKYVIPGQEALDKLAKK